MEHSKLSQHKYKKGKFTTPFNQIEGLREDSWFKNHLPEYVWIGLILNEFGRDQGLTKCAYIINHIIRFGIRLDSLRLSDIFSLSDSYQKQFYGFIKSLLNTHTFSPLTVIYTISTQPVFSEAFNDGAITYEERVNAIKSIVAKMADHQSEFSTDIRFIIVYYQIAKGKMHFCNDIGKWILKYPHLDHSDEKMRFIRPNVRSTEMSLRGIYKINNEFINDFWESVSRMIDCKAFYIEYPNDNNDTDTILDNYKKAIEYYSETFTNVCTFDEKMEVIVGIATYSFKRFSELVNHNLYNSISGRTIIRGLIENYIMIKYLLHHEKDHDNIWGDYKQYGIGQYKLIALRREENYADWDLSNSHVDYVYLHLLVNENKDEEFTDMDTTYFDKKGIRDKALEVDEKDLFDLYYDYDSAFEHGLWGAIRESSMLRCDEPCHQFHLIPDIENEQNLKSVWSDCVMIMNKTIAVLESIYGAPNKTSEKI